MSLNFVRLAAWALVAGHFAVAFAHDPGHMSDADTGLNQNLAEAEQARDELVASPTLSRQGKDSAQSAFSLTFLWDHDDVTVCFWPNPDGNSGNYSQYIGAVINAANRWNGASRVKLNFYENGRPRVCVDHDTADIRAALYKMPDDYYSASDHPVLDWDWARYGTAARDNSAKVSVSLVQVPVFYREDRDIPLNFDSAHEFGHALGLIHEHQRIDCDQWLADDATVMRAYGFKTTADLDNFKDNLRQIPESDAYLRSRGTTPFDINSVMMYNFPQSIWKKPLPGHRNPCVRPRQVEYPDEDDLKGLAAMYGPYLPAPSAATAAPPAAAPAPKAASTGALISRLKTMVLARQEKLGMALQHAMEGGHEAVRQAESRFRVSSFGLYPAKPTPVCLPNPFGPCVNWLKNEEAQAEAKLREMAAPLLAQAQKDVDAANRLAAALARAKEQATQ